MRLSKTLLPVFLLALSAACKGKQAETSRLDTFPVRTVAVERRDVEETIVLVGSVKAKDEATLFSRVPGKLLKNVLSEGDAVKKGQAVAQVERDEVGVKFEPAPVPSTLDGVVARVYLDQGENVTLQTPVALVVDTKQLFVRADVPERYAGRIRLGQDVSLRVDAYPGKAFKGSITRASPVVDSNTRTSLVEARILEGAAQIRPGMFGELHLVIGRAAGALSVPVDALTDGSGPAVFVIRDGKAFKREIEVGLKTDKFAEVRKGLAPGERVATFGLFGLKDGAAVEILPDETAAPR
jgi:multidrug efflux pump subunit AcrA (membrane-fusion protein)